MLDRLFGSKASRPTDEERAAAGQVVTLLQQRVFCGPAKGEITLTGDQDRDAVTHFRWMHGRARDVVAEHLRQSNPPGRTGPAVEKLHRDAARVVELLAPPVTAMSDVPPERNGDLAASMKGFLEGITLLGNVAQGNRWP